MGLGERYNRKTSYTYDLPSIAPDNKLRTVTSKSPHGLFIVSLKTLKWPLLSPVFPRLCLIAFTFCQPLLINRAIALSEQPVTDQTTNIGYGLIGAYVLVYVGIGVSSLHPVHPSR